MMEERRKSLRVLKIERGERDQMDLNYFSNSLRVEAESERVFIGGRRIKSSKDFENGGPTMLGGSIVILLHPFHFQVLRGLVNV